jgi:hypothetical protein
LSSALQAAAKGRRSLVYEVSLAGVPHALVGIAAAVGVAARGVPATGVGGGNARKENEVEG